MRNLLPLLVVGGLIFGAGPVGLFALVVGLLAAGWLFSPSRIKFLQEGE